MERNLEGALRDREGVRQAMNAKDRAIGDLEKLEYLDLSTAVRNASFYANVPECEIPGRRTSSAARSPRICSRASRASRCCTERASGSSSAATTCSTEQAPSPLEPVRRWSRGAHKQLG